tara:strand:+ start:1037 stop:4210 length:3174 start_codon:yes stop_codon:yes gene_type:complete
MGFQRSEYLKLNRREWNNPKIVLMQNNNVDIDRYFIKKDKQFIKEIDRRFGWSKEIKKKEENFVSNDYENKVFENLDGIREHKSLITLIEYYLFPETREYKTINKEHIMELLQFKDKFDVHIRSFLNLIFEINDWVSHWKELQILYTKYNEMCYNRESSLLLKKGYLLFVDNPDIENKLIRKLGNFDISIMPNTTYNFYQCEGIIYISDFYDENAILPTIAGQNRKTIISNFKYPFMLFSQNIENDIIELMNKNEKRKNNIKTRMENYYKKNIIDTDISKLLSVINKDTLVVSKGCEYHGKRLAKMMKCDFKSEASFNFKNIIKVGYFHPLPDSILESDINIIIWWVGSDVMRIGNKNIEQIKRHATHVCCSEQLKEELLQKGINVKEIMSIPPLKQKITRIRDKRNILIYMPSENPNKLDFYNYELMIDCIKKNPDIKFHIYGNKTELPIQLPNLVVHGWLDGKELSRLYNKCFILLRITKHDGFPNSIVIMKQMGRYAITNRNFPHVQKATKLDEINQIIREILKRDFDKKGSEYYSHNFSEEVVREKLFKYIAKNDEEKYKFTVCTLLSRKNNLMLEAIESVVKQHPDEFLVGVDAKFRNDNEILSLLEKSNATIIWQEGSGWISSVKCWRKMLYMAKYPYIRQCDDDDRLIGDTHAILKKYANDDVGAIFGFVKYPNRLTREVGDINTIDDITNFKGSGRIFSKRAINVIRKHLDMKCWQDYKMIFWMIKYGFKVINIQEPMSFVNPNVEPPTIRLNSPRWNDIFTNLQNRTYNEGFLKCTHPSMKINECFTIDLDFSTITTLRNILVDTAIRINNKEKSSANIHVNMGQDNDTLILCQWDIKRLHILERWMNTVLKNKADILFHINNLKDRRQSQIDGQILLEIGGLKHNYKHLWILHSDILPPPQISTQFKKKNVDIITGIVPRPYHPSGRSIKSYIVDLDEVRFNLSGDKDVFPYDNPFFEIWGSGMGCVFFNREVLETLGLHNILLITDKAIDTEWCEKLRKNYKFYVLSKAKCRHICLPLNAGFEQTEETINKNNDWLDDKWYGWLEK